MHPILITLWEVLQMMIAGAVGTGVYDISGYWKNHTYDTFEWKRFGVSVAYGAVIGFIAWISGQPINAISIAFIAILTKNGYNGLKDFLDNVSYMGFWQAVKTIKPW